MAAHQVLKRLGVDPETGLQPGEIKKRQNQFGRNQLRTIKPKSSWLILAEQFNSIVIWLLFASALISFIFGEWIDGSAVMAVIVINSMIGYVIELRAVRSMEALRKLSSVDTRVRRQEKIQKIPADELVPGDIVLVEGGDVIAADIRLFEASKLQLNESTLTGESEPVPKHVEKLSGKTPLAERNNMLFKGTAVTRGAGQGVVTATGMDTELGNISTLVEGAEKEHTPLEERLDDLGKRLVWITFAIIVVIAVTGILRGKEIMVMVKTSIALAVAAVPEGLPVVATIALARGLRRMAEQNALVNRLASVETLGSTNTICTDKTGTLTENQMTVTRIVLGKNEFRVSGEGLQIQGEFSQDETKVDIDEHPELVQALEAGILCTNAAVRKNPDGKLETVGEPLEIAILVAGLKAGIIKSELLSKYPEEREVAFDPELKMMATYNSNNGGYRVNIKGAPEAVLEKCAYYMDSSDRFQMEDGYKDFLLRKNKQLAEQGLRMLAFAEKRSDSSKVQPYQELTFLGLAAMHDPPREDVAKAIQSCKSAGIQVCMVTGDQPVTAKNIAAAVGLTDGDSQVVLGSELKKPKNLSEQDRQRFLSTPVFARVSPRQKLDLISLHQNAGRIVAMTGDGVNDAPALNKADIGIAMGQRGTQAAREAADMVLEDDAFSNIVLAVQLGRVIFNNIRRFVFYLISCNISEIMVVFLASLINLTLPIRPLQILYLNLVTDIFPALALGVGKGDLTIMERQPRDVKQTVLTHRHWMQISAYSLLITLVVLIAFGLADCWLGMSVEKTITISFLTLAFSQLWHVFNMREHGSALFNNDVMRNPYIWGAVVLSLLLLLAAVYFAPLSEVLGVVNPGARGWGLIFMLSVIPLLLGQLSKHIDISIN